MAHHFMQIFIVTKLKAKFFSFTERNTKIPVDVQHNGILYRKGQFVVTKNDDLVEFGEIILILVKDDATLYFLMRMYEGEFLSDYHMYSVKKDTGRLECKLVSELIDRCPLSCYIINGTQIVPLKHSVLS